MKKRLLLMGAFGVVAFLIAFAIRSYDKKIHPMVLPAPIQKQILMEQALLQVIASRPMDPRPRLTLAKIYAELGSPDLAKAQLMAVAEMKPNDPAGYAAAADADIAVGQFARAEAEYRQIVHRWPKFAEGWQGLAVALYQQKRYFESSESARIAVHLDPGQVSSQYVLATSLEEYAAIYPDPTDHAVMLKEARSILTKLLVSMPQNPDLYHRLGRLSYRLTDGRNAIRYLRHAQEMQPQRPDVAADLARTYAASGDRVAARKVVEAAFARHLESAVLLDLEGQYVQVSGEPDADAKALEYFRRASELEPNSAGIAEHLGIAYMRTNRLDEARMALLHATQLAPNESSAFQVLATLFTRQGDVKRAAKAAKLYVGLVSNARQLKRLQDLLSAHPESTPLRMVIADRYRDLKMDDPAREEYMHVLLQDPHNAGARKGMSLLASPSPKPPLAEAKR